MILGATFPDGSSLGLFLTKEDGSSAYDTDYSNIEYVSSNSGQTWTATTPILLTGTKANVYAYYPYNDNDAYKNITAIPIDVSENKDVMWATHAENVYNASPSATLPMNHALSVIRLSLSNGDYSGAGSIESIKIQGDCMAKTGTLNAKTGDLTATDGGTEIDFGITAENPVTLTALAQTLEQLVIPTTNGSPIKVTIQMDGKTFDATSTASFTPEKSKAYKFGLTFTDSKLSMSEVSIGVITEVLGEDMTPIVNNGLTWAQAKCIDGVYAIKSGGSPVAYADASDDSYTGVGFVMNGKAYQVSNTVLSNQYFNNYWWQNGYSDIGSLTNYQTAVGVYLYGHFDTFNHNGEGLSEDYKTWTTGSLSDFDGKGNTEKIIDIIGGTTANTIAKVTVDFRSGSSNQGFTDWFIPSMGELAYMYLNHIAINELLTKCDGQKDPTGDYGTFWSSTEYDSEKA